MLCSNASCWLYDQFFAWIHGALICLFWETQKCVEILNNIWIITFYIGIFAIFNNFVGNFCLIHSSCWFYDHFFTWIYGTRICFFWTTQKYVEILNNIWVTAFYIGMLVIFGRFWANFALFTLAIGSDCIFDWNHVRQK